MSISKICFDANMIITLIGTSRPVQIDPDQIRQNVRSDQGLHCHSSDSI